MNDMRPPPAPSECIGIVKKKDRDLRNGEKFEFLDIAENRTSRHGATFAYLSGIAIIYPQRVWPQGALEMRVRPPVLEAVARLHFLNIQFRIMNAAQGKT